MVFCALLGSLAADDGCCEEDGPGLDTDSSGESTDFDQPDPDPGCANPIEIEGVGTTGYDGVQFECEGEGNAEFRAEVSCELPGLCTPLGDLAENIADCVNANDACPDYGLWTDDDDNDGGKPPREIDVNLFTYEFQGASVVGCCDENCIGDEDSCGIDGACLSGCVNMGCENVPGYLDFLLGDTNKLAEICCSEVGVDQYDCLGDQLGDGPLIDMCKSAITVWRDQTESGFRNKCIVGETQCTLDTNNYTACNACGGTGTQECSCASDCMENENCCDNVCDVCDGNNPACWQFYCAEAQLAGVDAYLRPVDTEVSVSVFDVPVFLRNVAIDTACETAATGGVVTVGGEVLSCDGPSWNGLPDGWPDDQQLGETIFDVEATASASGSEHRFALPVQDAEFTSRGHTTVRVDCDGQQLCVASIRGELRGSVIQLNTGLDGPVFEIERPSFYLRADQASVKSARDASSFTLEPGTLAVTISGSLSLGEVSLGERVITTYNNQPVTFRESASGHFSSSLVEVSWRSVSVAFELSGRTRSTNAPPAVLSSKP